MNEQFELLRLLDEPVRRRSWLLFKALECMPLDQAVGLAQAADEFIAGFPAESRNADAQVAPESLATVPLVTTRQPADVAAGCLHTVAQRRLRQCSGLSLSPDQRERLLERLAEGARNAELATEFGLSPKQVQGIRIGSAREIARRRERQSQRERPPESVPAVSASMEDVVRYLRQQDDVVVPEEQGEFLVNARFRLELAELVGRANRMRRRQGKPPFVLAGNQRSQIDGAASANGHVLR